MNRRLTAPLADLHFAPTERARANLLAEGIAAGSVHVTGNTVVDALLSVRDRLRVDRQLDADLRARFPFLDGDGKRTVLVTGHRRENFGAGFENICVALRDIAARGDVRVVYPVHLNPNVQEPVRRILDASADVHLIEPQDYLPFVWLMDRCDLIVTDSGGVQEEAPSLGKPVLVLRDTTERPEAIAAGTVRLIGTTEETVYQETQILLSDPVRYRAMSEAVNPYGDGRASQRIVQTILWRNALSTTPPTYF